MPGPFEPTDGPEDTHLLLVNDIGQQSLWPAFAAIPDGWTVQAVEAAHPVHPEGDPR
ncbi:uncharacterized protein YbdZ (MbtH family) [Streptomyces sp. LBL]|uniref:MbtH family NRPS accessory protein n=1 Tax=Streptomyces sp. LBL TaxID=2940562 RepID=UPI0024767998|nr:MbtH family NRPS accessory protein [Streptomyces sp. LBL]MDH6624463.1 uncharacterized protein YbdZ (MbtH family) [Streptomyces sp. LBL]